MTTKNQQYLTARQKLNNKEFMAMALNKKQQQILHKAVAMIHLESTHSLKLLEIESRAIKIGLKKLMDRIFRIKSHLSTEEIMKLQKLDMEDKLRPQNSRVNVHSASGIEEPTNGINTPSSQLTEPHNIRCVKKCHFVTNHTSGSYDKHIKRHSQKECCTYESSPFSHNERPKLACRALSALRTTARVCAPSSFQARSKTAQSSLRPSISTLNKKTGAYLSSFDTNVSDKRPSYCQQEDIFKKHRNYIYSSRNKDRPNTNTQSYFRFPCSSPMALVLCSESSLTPLTNECRQTNHSNPEALFVASTTNLVQTAKCDKYRRNNSSKTSAKHKSDLFQTCDINVGVPFSSHYFAQSEDIGDKTCNEINISPSSHVKCSPQQYPQCTSDEESVANSDRDKLMDKFEKDRYVRKRLQLLESEKRRSAVINKRKEEFLKVLANSICDNSEKQSIIKFRAENKFRKNFELNAEGVRKIRKVEFNTSPTCFSEADYQERLMSLWHDMNKCRYLRVPDEMIDLSGFNTLVSDNMKMLHVLKMGNPSSSHSSTYDDSV